jgi:NAD(P)-dependent dehydrogenase (short-subunit alcohol dehydrogenase family)
MKTALIVGASRNIGLEIARAYLRRGWEVIATVRGSARTPLHDLADEGRLVIARTDMTEPDDLAALRDLLRDTELDLLFVNAGITNDDVPVHEVSTEDFSQVMVTNALGPLRAIDALGSLVKPTGTIAVMSSRQGSISMNTRGGHEVYRASKSALNQLMRSFAARHGDDPHTLLLIAPGWVQTDLGGAGAPLTIDQSIPGVADTIEAQAGKGGLQYLDYRGQTVRW